MATAMNAERQRIRLFAIADLHLPGGMDKPMDKFGDKWSNHFQRISADWQLRVGEADVVLIPGDISWAMQFEQAMPDLLSIAALPGRKLLLKGNHDYWWPAVTRLRSELPPEMDVIQHDALDVGPAVVCGSRGWLQPGGTQQLSAEDLRVYRRELIRLELSLGQAKAMAHGKPIVCMTHYPPLLPQRRDSDVSRLLEQYGVHTVVYGHLHGAAIQDGFSGMHGRVRYQLVSCDSLGFQLKELLIDTEEHTEKPTAG